MTHDSRLLLAAITTALALSACSDSNEPPRMKEELASAVDAVDAHVVRQTRAGTNLPVRGTINARWDGDDWQWAITTLADTTRMSAGMVSDAGLGRGITLWGQAHSPSESSLQLELSYYSGTFSKDAVPDGLSLTLIPHAGIAPPHWVAQDDLEVTLSHAEFDGQTGRIEGRFSATLCHRASMYDRPDTANCAPIEGDFASDLALEVL